jgi:hypothetical protein
MKPISEMTPAELRIACAERMGWKYIPSDIAPCKAPNGVGWTDYPDYEHDLNVCIELMEKVWEKRPNAVIEKNSEYFAIGWDVDLGYDSEYIDDWFLQIVIMRAFLTVMDEK